MAEKDYFTSPQISDLFEGLPIPSLEGESNIPLSDRQNLMALFKNMDIGYRTIADNLSMGKGTVIEEGAKARIEDMNKKIEELAPKLKKAYGEGNESYRNAIIQAQGELGELWKKTETPPEGLEWSTEQGGAYNPVSALWAKHEINAPTRARKTMGMDILTGLASLVPGVGPALSAISGAMTSQKEGGGLLEGALKGLGTGALASGGAGAIGFGTGGQMGLTGAKAGLQNFIGKLPFGQRLQDMFTGTKTAGTDTATQATTQGGKDMVGLSDILGGDYNAASYQDIIDQTIGNVWPTTGTTAIGGSNVLTDLSTGSLLGGPLSTYAGGGSILGDLISGGGGNILTNVLKDVGTDTLKKILTGGDSQTGTSGNLLSSLFGEGGILGQNPALVAALLGGTGAGMATLLSGGESRAKAEEGLADAGGRISDASRVLPEELSQYKGSFQTGQSLNDLLMGRLGLKEIPAGALTPEQQYRGQGELAESLYGQTLRGVQDPDALYKSTLNPQLQAAEDYINRAFQSRGLIRSGMPIESMGRAGVELAIKEAEGMMANRSNLMAQGRGLTQDIGAMDVNRINQLSNLYGTQQQQGQTSMQRQLTGETQAAPYYAAPYTARLGDIYGRKAAAYAFPGQAVGALGLALSGK